MSRVSRFLFAALLAAAPALTALSTARAAAPFVRHPDIFGDRVVFTSEGDLWLGSIATGEARRLTNHPGIEGEPHFSPDGKLIAFSGQYDGGPDVYVMPADGGEPKRLTWDPRGTRVMGWTPDGKNVLFTSRRYNPESRRRLWSVPADGGAPVLLPIPQVDHASMGPDGRSVAYVPVSAEWQHWKHYQAGQADDIWLADIKGRIYRRLTTSPYIDTTPTWAGGQIYYASERSGLMNLYRVDPATGKSTAITHYTDDEVRYPSSGDGKRVIFQHDSHIALYDPATDKVTELSFRMNSDLIHAREHRVPALGNLAWTAVGPTGKRMLLEARGQIVSAPIEEGDWRILENTPGARARYPSWSSDGKQVAFVSDRSGEEEVWVAPANGPATNSDGAVKARQLTKDHKGPLGKLLWSPDSKYIATSDREMRILLVDVKTGATTLVDQADRAGAYDSTNFSAVFSPDGKWLAFNRTEPNWFSRVYLYNIAKKTKTPLTNMDMSSYNPAFDPTGKYLFFLSDRDFSNPQGSGPTNFFSFDKYTKVSMVPLAADTKSPFLPKDIEEAATDDAKKDDTKDADKKDEKKDTKSEDAKSDDKKDADKKDEGKDAPKLPTVKVDLDGIADRIIDVPVPGDRYSQVDATEDRILLLAGGDPGTNNSLKAFSLKDWPKKRDLATVASGIDDFEMSADHKKILLRTGRTYTLIDASAGSVPGDASKPDLSNITLVVDPRAEWKQVFNESWRIARDFFYDPNMHGVDWAAVKAKYAAKLDNVGDRSELNEILGDMIAELNVGHAYVGGGDEPGGVPSPRMGYLGADLEAAPNAPAYRITKILEGDGYDFANRCPLAAPGLNVKVGDYILAIAGQPVRTDQDFQALLVGTPGRVITLTVNDKPTMEGAREIRIRPMADDSKARYYDWVNSRREYVKKYGGDDLAYIHIPDMSAGGLTEFTKHFYANVNKDGIIYDVRNNGGGYIGAMLMMQMATKPSGWYKPRYGASWTYQGWGVLGYSALLCNEQSFSNAEYFTDLFQREKLGPVVGVHTGGGEVGSGGGWPLIDGGKIYIPNYGEWSADGKWLIEGKGADPDINVSQDPNAVMNGRDPQLDAAIAYMKDQIAKHPVPRPTPPPFPDKAWRPAVAAK